MWRMSNLDGVVLSKADVGRSNIYLGSPSGYNPRMKIISIASASVEMTLEQQPNAQMCIWWMSFYG